MQSFAGRRFEKSATGMEKADRGKLWVNSTGAPTRPIWVYFLWGPMFGLRYQLMTAPSDCTLHCTAELSLRDSQYLVGCSSALGHRDFYVFGIVLYTAVELFTGLLAASCLIVWTMLLQVLAFILSGERQKTAGRAKAWPAGSSV